MNQFSYILEQVKRRELELQARREELKDLAVDITEEDRERIVKKSAKDFFFFAKKVFPEYCTKPFSELHRDIHKFGMEMRRKVHVVAGPPEHGKTAIFRIFKIWAAIYGHRHYIIKVTETMELSTIDLESIKVEFEDNARLKFLYGDLIRQGKWEKDAFKIAPTKFNKYGCWFEAFAFGVPPTGRLREQFRPDLCDIDDLENYRKSGNLKISKEKLEFINNDIIPRLALHSPILWFGNNARKTMAINIIVEMKPEERIEKYPAFIIHIYPAWDRKKNRPLWNEAYNFETETEMRLHFGVGMMTWQGNYMQSPVVAEGTEFQRKHWREYSDLPKDALGIIMCDPAGGKKSAFKAGVFIAYSRTTGNFHVHTCFVQQCDWEPYFQWLYKTYLTYMNHIRYIGWESDFYQDQYILFRKLYPSVKDKPDLPILPIEVKGQGNKDERTRTLAVPYEVGQILFHKDFLLTPDGIEAQAQLIGFPDYPYRDFDDALATGYRKVFEMFAGVISDENSGSEVYESIERLRSSRTMF